MSVAASGPLNSSELKRLAANRATRAERRLFLFASSELVPDKDFKRSMPAEGGWYDITVPHRDFPAWAASHLKYKKHEWLVVGISDGLSVRSVWMNKGPDSQLVLSLVTIDDILSATRPLDCRIILVLHNHPNSNPRRYDCSRPSRMDKVGAKAWWEELNPEGCALAEFVCERGRYYRFFGKSPGNVIHEEIFLPILEEKNVDNFWSNAALRLELVFGR